MTKLQEKLLSNKLRLEHESFISHLSGPIRELFTSCRHTSDINIINNLALPSWDNGVLTTSRGQLENWYRNDYPTWKDVKKALLEFNIPINNIGWFTINHDGMHYEISGQLLSENIEDILDILKTDNNEFDAFSWVGKEKDFGVVFEWNDNYGKENDFEICYWGI